MGEWKETGLLSEAEGGVELCSSVACSFRSTMYFVIDSQKFLSREAGCVKVCGPADTLR